MALPTYSQLQQELQGATGDGSADSLTHFKRFLNDAQRCVWQEYPWYFRRGKARFNTVAPYLTGTITATKGSTTLNISGGSLTGLAGYKFALAPDSPYYLITAVAGNGLSATLETAYAEATVSTTAFLIYRDEYELPDSVKTLLSIKLLRAGYPELDYASQDTIDDFMTAQRFGKGLPRLYNTDALPTSLSTSQKALHVYLAPIPDDTYPLEYTFLKSVSDMSADDDTPSVPEEFLSALKYHALANAYRLDYQTAEQGTASWNLYVAEIEKLKATFKEDAGNIHVLRPYDERPRHGLVNLPDYGNRGWIW